MSDRRFLCLGIVAMALTSMCSFPAAAQTSNKIQRVLLISVDGMHAVDFANCANGISTVNGGRTLLPGAGRAGQDRHQLRCCQHLEALGFLPGPDRHRYRRKPRLDRRLL